jgi:hypothetical protein
MAHSQIDMVVLINGAMLKVCGDFELEQGRASKRPEVHVVVQQGDIVAKGQRAVDQNLTSWTVVVATDQPQQFTAGQPAIACGVIIVEKEPAGLEALSWAQEVDVQPVTTIRDEKDENKPFHFPPPESVVSPQGGQLPPKRAVSSSLAILPTGDDTLSWRHEVEIRSVKPATVISPTAQ